ncbi:MAG: CPBP family intramembrane glutamic endopeptidase [Balneolales bacterium]
MITINYIFIHFQKKAQNTIGLFILEMVILLLFLDFIFFTLQIYIPHEHNNNLFDFYVDKSWTIIFFTACIIGPFVETIIFQSLPIELVKLKTDNILISIIVSSLVFSIAHFGVHIIDMVLFFMSGIILAWSYVVNLHKGWGKSIIITYFIHAIYNFIHLVIILI